MRQGPGDWCWSLGFDVYWALKETSDVRNALNKLSLKRQKPAYVQRRSEGRPDLDMFSNNDASDQNTINEKYCILRNSLEITGHT